MTQPDFRAELQLLVNASNSTGEDLSVWWDAVDRAEAALATPPPEPVAYIHRQGNYWEPSERVLQDDEKERGWTEEPLYAATPPPEPLTDEAESKPVAWMYRGEPAFDGTEWREIWKVTTDKRLAEYKAKPDQPIPLFSVLYRAADTTPPPEPPTDEELWAIGEDYLDDIDRTYAIKFVRAVLERWGK